MRKNLSTLAFLALATTLAFAADARGPSRGGGTVTVLGKPAIGVFPAAPAAIAPSFRNSTFPRTRFHGGRPVAGFGVPVYVGPPAYYDPSVEVAPPVAYAAPPIPPAPVAPPAPPEVVEHSDGRYVLRGDGISTPYRWVWVPNPPTAPPTTAAPKPDVRLYAWTDEHGVLNVTDRLDKVPARHREQAKRNASS